MSKNNQVIPTNDRSGIDEAMFNIKKELTAVKKNSNNPFFNSKYADLNSYLELVEPILIKNGCSLRQPTQFHGGQNLVVTAIIHTATGKEASASLGLGEQKDMQKLGGAITYARRYTLDALLAMRATDDDGNTAVGKVVKTKSADKGDF